jgi:magnesium transporter
MKDPEEILAAVEGHALPPVVLELIRYDRTRYQKFDSLTVDELLHLLAPDQVNWVNLDGIHEHTAIMERLQTHFCLHSLMVEDILQDQRPKTEEFEDYLFVTVKMLHRINGIEIDYEQISFVLGKNYLLSFQEKEGDLFDAFRERIRLDLGRVRKKKADYLMYRLIDIIVDSYYHVLDNIGEQIEEIEETIQESNSRNQFSRIQSIRKELIFLRKALYPLRDAISKLVKDESGFIHEDNIRYYSDVYDHVIHLIDSLDTYQDLTAGLTDMHLNTQSNRMNEVMRVLTIISTIFIPLTFIVGVYGMNFDNMPELHWHNGYYEVWGIMIFIACAMMIFFKYKKWF